MKKFTIFITIGILFIAGCTLGPDFQSPKYTGNDIFRFDTLTTDTVVNLRWWELFNDPELNKLIKIALNNNKDVLIASARIDAAKANFGYTKADQFPAFGFSVSGAGGNYGGGNLLNSNASNFSAYPEMNWELGFWGKYKRLNEAARAELMASEFGKRTVQISIISAVASTYFSLLEYKEKLEISKQTLASRDSGLKIVQARYDYGVVAEIDLNQAQIQKEISAAAVPSYERAVAITENTLSILLGENPKGFIADHTLIEQQTPPEIPEGLPSQLLQRRPDIREAEQLYKAQNARIGAAQAMRWPSLNITGLLGYASNDLMNITTGGLAWSAAGSLTGPLFQFGKNKRRVEIERYNTEVALIQYENTALTAFKEVADALITIKTLKTELAANKSRNIAAINAEMLSAERYDKGQTSYLEVLESQRQSFDAQLTYTQTQRELLDAYISLYKALGGGWISPEEEASSK